MIYLRLYHNYLIEEDEIDVKAHWGYDSYKYEDSYYSIRS